MAIRAVHTLIYSDDAPATRAFLRDVLGWPCVDGQPHDPSQGWLIFGTGPSELGVHPTSGTHEGHTFESPRHHEIALICDDVAATRSELESNGAQFENDIVDEGFGLTTLMQVPGADPIMLYEPRHPTAFDA